MPRVRVYVDTSVFGGVLDDEFKTPSKVFFDQIRHHQFILVTSAVVQEEIVIAPQPVQELFQEVLLSAEVIDVKENALKLRDAYLKAKVVSSKHSDDALHVALATVGGCSMIVSWNFRHIVHFEKISLYNAINAKQGYKQIAIFSPLEVIRYEETI